VLSAVGVTYRPREHDRAFPVEFKWEPNRHLDDHLHGDLLRYFVFLLKEVSEKTI
jgi:hypothetical protein